MHDPEAEVAPGGSGVLDQPAGPTQAQREAADAHTRLCEELDAADAAAVLDDDIGDEPEARLSSHPVSCPFCGVPIGTHADWESKCHRPGG